MQLRVATHNRVRRSFVQGRLNGGASGADDIAEILVSTPFRRSSGRRKCSALTYGDSLRRVGL